jgi:hypothetical protein
MFPFASTAIGTNAPSPVRSVAVPEQVAVPDPAVAEVGADVAPVPAAVIFNGEFLSMVFTPVR